MCLNILVFGMALLLRIVRELSFLISQTSAKPEQKRPSIVNAVLKSIKETLSTFSGLIALWEKLKPCFCVKSCLGGTVTNNYVPIDVPTTADQLGFTSLGDINDQGEIV